MEECVSISKNTDDIYVNDRKFLGSLNYESISVHDK